jgi:hypothetical protein
MTLKHHPRWLRPHPPWPWILQLQGAIIDIGYSPISTPVIAYPHQYDATTMGDNGSSTSIFGLFSNLTVCGAPVMTVEDVRVYLVD